MTPSFYEQQVSKLSKQLYPKEYITEQIIGAKRFMDVHYQDKIDLDTVAQKAYCSKFRFIRLFRSYYGRTPHQYLLSLRMEKAKQMLRSGLPVKEACTATGFDSITYFSGLFKRSIGFSPALYRKKQFSRRLLAAQT